MFAPNCYPPRDPEAFVNANLVIAMCRAGWEVTVITQANAHQRYPTDLAAWTELADCIITVKEPSRNMFNRSFHALKSLLHSGHFMPGGRWALAAASTALELMAEKKYDVILSRALPHISHLAALIVKKKTGIKWIANWNDPVPSEKFPVEFEVGKGKEAPLGFWGTRYYEEIARLADWHTFPCERLRCYIDSYLPYKIMQKSSVIPHIASDYHAVSSEVNKCFTLMHAGSFIAPRSPEMFLKGLSLFREHLKPEHTMLVRLLLDNPRDVMCIAEKYGVQDVVKIEQSRPYTEMPAILNEADVLFIIEGNIAEGIFLPSKFVDYTRTGKPILAISPKNGTLADIITSNGGGIAVDANNAENVLSALKELYDSWRVGMLIDCYGSENLYHMFSPSTVLKKYEDIFASL